MAKQNFHTDVGSEWLKARPSLGRRLCAEIIDRLAPFAIAPIIAIPMTLIGSNGFFWTWNSVAFLWHLLRDCSANRRSLGKWLLRLRVVSVNGRRQCAWQRVIARRLLSAMSQSAYSIAIVASVMDWLKLEQTPWPWPLFTEFAIPLLLLAFGYDFASLASILITDGGRRVEDFMVDTCVVCGAAYTRNRKKCGACGELALKSETYCWRCGERNAPEIKIRRMIEPD
jgi:uncharacterized RDD family membrane protein YckC